MFVGRVGTFITGAAPEASTSDAGGGGGAVMTRRAAAEDGSGGFVGALGATASGRAIGREVRPAGIRSVGRTGGTGGAGIATGATTGAAGAAGAGATGGATEGGAKKDDVIDAEYEVTDDGKKA